MIRFACPGCSATFTVTDEKAGKTGKCPKCQTQFTIPFPQSEENPPPPTSVEAPPPMQSVEAPPPIPPAVEPPAAPEPVEILPCPKCTSRLSVLPGDVGLDVECPNCQTVYRAARADAPPPPVIHAPKSSALVQYGSGAKKNTDDDDDEEDERPSRRKKKRRRDDDDDDDDDDRPVRRRRSRGSRRNYQPHRGVLILVLAIVSWVTGIFFIGIVAWVLGVADMKEIDSGRMDPEGRSMTQIGLYLGMAHVILSIVGIIAYCGIFACIFGAAGVGAGGR